ncbi:MAG: hypothetical protein GC206_10645 [Alphaproteobacteria bacterium]|nr:hypothetical protein [Alphaproteobacteria bacterium]
MIYLAIAAALLGACLCGYALATADDNIEITVVALALGVVTMAAGAATLWLRRRGERPLHWLLGASAGVSAGLFVGGAVVASVASAAMTDAFRSAFTRAHNIQAATVLRDPSPPLTDGACTDYHGAARHVGEALTYVTHQDRDFVWVCLQGAALRGRGLDLVAAAPGLSAPLHIHVSAQLGEWPEGNAAAAPQSPTDARWWNNQGWTAQAMRFNGLAADGRPRFRESDSIELQFAKARFGRGAWRLGIPEMGAIEIDAY